MSKGYEKPDFVYWTAEELDGIEAMMSHGHGGGGYSASWPRDALAQVFHKFEMIDADTANAMSRVWTKICDAYPSPDYDNVYRSWLAARFFGGLEAHYSRGV